MEGGLKESEESCRITILLHSAHPPRSSLSVSLYNLKTQTVTPTLPSPKPTLQQRARQPNEKKKAKGNSFACVFGRPVCGCSSPVEHFTLLLLLKRQIIVTYFSYYYGCGLLLCSFDCTVYFLVISDLFLLLFLLTSMTPTRVPYYQWLFFCTTKGCLCETNKYRHVIHRWAYLIIPFSFCHSVELFFQSFFFPLSFSGVYLTLEPTPPCVRWTRLSRSVRQ